MRTGGFQAGFDGKYIEFDPLGAGLFDLTGVVDPALTGHAIQTGDDGNVRTLRGPAHQIQVFVRRGGKLVEFDHGKIPQGLGETVRPLVHGIGQQGLFALYLLLEQRKQHHRRGAAILQPVDAIQGFR